MDILGQIRQGNLPPHAREAVVKGLMPLEPEHLIFAIYYICDQAPDLLPTAQETFQGLPEGLKKTFFENKTIDSELVAFYLKNFTLPEVVLGVVLLNPATPSAAVRDVAQHIPGSLLDLVVNNQVKIQAEPEIIKFLRLNPSISINHVQKLDDYERLLFQEIVSPAEVLESQSIEDIEKQAIAEAKEFVGVFGKEKVTSKDLLSSPKIEAVDPADEHQQERLSVIKQLTTMTIPQKVQAAIKGDKEVRGILIREANKLVCCAVIKSPRVTEAEVEFYSNLRNVQQDVLRLIAQNREWIRNYKIIHNLVKNPRTPLTYSMKFLSRLNKTDLRNLERDRGIPEVLRTTAKRLTRSGG